MIGTHVAVMKNRRIFDYSIDNSNEIDMNFGDDVNITNPTPKKLYFQNKGRKYGCTVRPARPKRKKEETNKKSNSQKDGC